MATKFQKVDALVFEGLTTAQRDALNAQENMFILNIETGRYETYIGGVWRGVPILDTDGKVSSSQHGSHTDDLHPPYANIAAPEEITTGWLLVSGGTLRPLAGDPPVGEVGIQRKTSTGAPTHSAGLGTLCWVEPDDYIYVNNDGDVGWTKQAKSSDLQNYILVDGTRPLIGDWDNIGLRIRNTGVAEVAASAPTTPAAGLIWLDTDAIGTGGLGILNVTTITVDATLTTSQTVVLCDASGGAITVTLPAASGNAGRHYHIKKIDSSGNAVTIEGDGSETIDGKTTQAIAVQYNSINIVCDGSEWHIL